MPALQSASEEPGRLAQAGLGQAEVVQAWMGRGQSKEFLQGATPSGQMLLS